VFAISVLRSLRGTKSRVGCGFFFRPHRWILEGHFMAGKVWVGHEGHMKREGKEKIGSDNGWILTMTD